MISANTGHLTLAGAERRGSRENVLLAECRIRSESFVYELPRGRSRPPGQGSHGMTTYLISFDAHAMDHIPDEDMPAVAKAAHAVVQEALNAGVYLFTGGLENQRASIVATDGAVPTTSDRTLAQDLPWRRSDDAGLRTDLNWGRAASPWDRA